MHFIVLPCPSPPPEKPENGWFHYDIVESRYRCPHGYMFEGDIFPYFIESCTPAKVWDPPEVPPCIREFIFNH